MRSYDNPYYSGAFGQPYAGSRSISDIMRLVYLWVAAGLVVCFGVSLLIAHFATPLLFNPILLIVALVAYIGLGLAFFPIIQRTSVATGAALYLVFAAVFGFLLSAVWLAYTTSTISSAFITTAA